MTKQRPCDACGGSGQEIQTRKPLDYCGRPGVQPYCCCKRHRPCPACSGRGRQSDAMPVSDALADAATLLSMTWAGDWQHCLGALEAARIGSAVMPMLNYYNASDYARAAASSAFSAVPGLRE